MNIDYVLLCDYATLGQGDKLTAVGVFTTINVDHLPAIQAPFYVVIGQGLDPSDAGSNFSLNVSLTHTSGRQLFKLEAAAIAKDSSGDPIKGRIHHVVLCQNVEFRETGEHVIDVSLNDQPSRKQWLNVRLKEPIIDGVATNP